MTFNLKKVFEDMEGALIASSTLAPDRFREAVEWTRHLRRPSDHTEAEVFLALVNVTFYAGMRSDIVAKKMPAVLRHLGSWERVCRFDDADVSAYRSDPHVIHNENKLRACVENARTLVELRERYGSFWLYARGFEGNDVLALRSELKRRFRYLGDRTVLHFMMELGYPVIKPDRVICRIFSRLGLVNDESDLDSVLAVGSRMVRETELPTRYVDLILVKYGQVADPELGIKGICVEDRPRCDVCGVADRCRSRGR